MTVSMKRTLIRLSILVMNIVFWGVVYWYHSGSAKQSDENLASPSQQTENPPPRTVSRNN